MNADLPKRTEFPLTASSGETDWTHHSCCFTSLIAASPVFSAGKTRNCHGVIFFSREPSIQWTNVAIVEF